MMTTSTRLLLPPVMLLGVLGCANMFAAPEGEQEDSPEAVETSVPEGADAGVEGDESAQEPEAGPLDGVHIALDPGHAGGIAADPQKAQTQVDDGRGGWKDCQAVGASTNSGYTEHAFNWDVSQRLTELLEEDGAEVRLTRENDEAFGPCVDERGQFPQEVGADVYVSIHANGSDPSYSGYFAIVSDPPLNAAQGEPSLEVAEHLNEGLAQEGFDESNLIPGGISQRSDIAGLNWAEVPAVMMELGEMRHAEESAVMETEEGRQRYADALHNGLLSWAETQEEITEE
ncbi:N-acetylmuramoyl-L-alanine amidase [Nesterenkonia sedimenti]|nr:N-acetylmuramoyl-L-alanine amidase [Nesterenkonia sedimenti]